MSGIHQPKPRFVLNVGIVGHRPNRLPEATRANLERQLGEILVAIREHAVSATHRYRHLFADLKPLFVLAAAMAEGADLMAASAALAAGYELDVILPFGRTEYERDFSPQGRLRFQALLLRAHSVFELPGTRKSEPEAYEAAGLAVLDHADILVAVWDGGPPHGRGGTAELLAKAARSGIPIVHIVPDAATKPRLLWQRLGAHQQLTTYAVEHPSIGLDEGLSEVIDRLVTPASTGG